MNSASREAVDRKARLAGNGASLSEYCPARGSATPVGVVGIWGKQQWDMVMLRAVGDPETDHHLVKKSRFFYSVSLPVEIISDTLSEEERLRVWVFIHRQRKEWDTREKESVAYALVDLVGRASASDILGVSVREIEKLVDVFDVSQRLTNLREAGASITWARELMGISKKLLTPESKIICRIRR